MKTKNLMGNQESLTKTIAKGGLFFSIRNFIDQIVSFVSALVVIKLLSVYDYGLWQLILAGLSIFLMFTFPTITQIAIADSSVEYGKKNFKNYKAILKQYSFLTILLAIFVWLIIFLSAPLISKITGKNLTLFFQILSFYVLGEGILGIYQVFFYSELRFKAIASLKILSRISYLVLILLFLLFFKLGLTGVVLAYVLPSFIASFLFLPLFIKRVSYLRKIWEGDKKIFWQGLKTHGKWGIATDYLTKFLANLRPWIIGYFLGVKSVAIFSVAQSFYEVVTFFLPLDSVLRPIIPRIIFEKERIDRLFQKSVKYSIWIYLGLLIISLIFVPTFIKVVFPKYSSSISLFYIIIFALLPLGPSVILHQTFYALKAQKELFISSLVKAFSVAIILPFSILLFGLRGTALEFTLLAYLIVLTRYFIIKKVQPDISFNLVELFRFDQQDRILIEKIINKIKRQFR